MTITIVVTAVFMTNLDVWIVNVALVDIGRDLNSSLSGVSWVLNAYAVTLAAVLIPALGVALLVTILDAVTDPIHAYQISWVIAAAVAIGAGAASLALPQVSDAVPAPLPVTEGVTA
jgi:MFS family permease